MTSLTEFFSRQEDDNLKGISHKNNLFKRNIIAHMAVNGECTLSELTKELHISVPTITKLVQELVQENIVSDLGKVETPGGRRPNVFGLASSAIYFAGVNIGRDNMSFLITDLHNNIVKEELLTDFELQDRPQCLEKICSNIAHFIDTCGVERAKILGVGVSVSGRVNPTTGRSYRYFTSSEQSLRDMIEQRIGIRVLLENDSRARCYAEYTNSKSKDEMDVLYLHLGRGLAIGIVMNGKLYYGKSGFAGEFGHIPFFDNEIICSCGKKGCLETEVSGIAIEQKFGRLISQGVNTILREKYNKHEAIHVDEIIDAAKHDDNLSIELIEEVGEKAGKAVAFLINTFNPEKKIKLATYASRCIENEILMYLRRNSRTRMEVSIDEPLNVDWDGNELLLSDILGTDEDVIYRDLEHEVECKLLVKAINKLNAREKMIICLRFGLNQPDGKEKTQKEVADLLGISQSYISRLEKRIMVRLKKEIVRYE